MIIDKKLTAFIRDDLIRTANILGIEKVIIEKEKIRGMDEKQTTIILHHHSLPVPFKALGLSRLSLLNSRLSLTKEEITIDAVEDPKNAGIISKLDIKAKKFKVDFRTTNPTMSKAPNGFNFNIDEYQVKITLTDDDRDLLIKASNSMPQRTESGSVAIIVDENGSAKFILTDTNSDDFEMEIEGTVDMKSSTKMFVNYPLKQFISLIKHNDETFSIITRNLLKTTINNITVLILPIV